MNEKELNKNIKKGGKNEANQTGRCVPQAM